MVDKPIFKKVVIIFLVSILFSCNSDDDSKKESLYSVNLEQVCNDGGEYYCVTKAEYDRAKEYYISEINNAPCIWITITDANNKKHSGYYNGGRGSCAK